MIRIKICGMTRPEDAVAAAEAGVDAIGLVFAKSPRQVTVRQACRIAAALQPFVSAVGVFVNARAATVLRTADDVGLSEVQLHGDESPEFVTRLHAAQARTIRVIKALRVRDRAFVDQVSAFSDVGVAGILLDAFSPQARGGSGKRFDWDLVAGTRESGALDNAPPLILAGGLTPQNVRAGIRRLRPWGVDTSSGVEDEPGIKSAEKIAQFVMAARSA
ncbi:MAG: phosphoribosylanthranilate isomerase [Phycisphaerae bacterium]|nr:phosphoribosylanthranilate isomerase [Phycisphaerae bacterium]